jgi:hypothetical protein
MAFANHVVAWNVSHALNLDAVPGGVVPNVTKYLILDLRDSARVSRFGHPSCQDGTPPDQAIKALRECFPTGPKEEGPFLWFPQIIETDAGRFRRLSCCGEVFPRPLPWCILPGGWCRNMSSRILMHSPTRHRAESTPGRPTTRTHRSPS